eukprot:superscaffoldBa00001643_g11418
MMSSAGQREAMLQVKKAAEVRDVQRITELGRTVCTSRFWFNYRHVANTLSVYRSVKRLGIPDSHIVLMLADDMACNHRNPKPATVFSHKNMELNVYGDDVEVDYRGYEVTVENFLRVLTGRLPPSTPRSKRLLSDDRSNILIYLTGHGGNGFLKFQDSEEISNVELADAFEQMWQKRRYNELLFIIDTCQGASMYERFYSPNLMALASSQVGEDSLSHQPDLAIGVHLMDRYTFYLLEFLEDIHPASKANMNDLRSTGPRDESSSPTPIPPHQELLSKHLKSQVRVSKLDQCVLSNAY